MKKFLSVLAFGFILIFSETVFADGNYRIEDQPEYDSYVKHILTFFEDEKYVRNTLTGDKERWRHWSYSIYYCPKVELQVANKLFDPGRPGYLIFLSHGSYGRDGYQLFIDGTGYRDYVGAVDRLLTHFRNAGYFNGLDYSYVLVNTCYPGYMNYESYLPQMKTNMRRAINHYDVTYHTWSLLTDGRVRLQLYKAHTLNNQGVESTSSPRNGKTDVIEYKGKMFIIGK